MGTARVSSVGITFGHNLQGFYGTQDTLFIYNNHGKLIPEMATTVPSLKNRGILDRGKTIVIHLKHGLRWSNGTEITSSAIKFGWLIDRDPITHYPSCQSSCGVIKRIDTPDRYTAILRLKSVTPPLLINDQMPDIWPTRWPHAWNGSPHRAAVKLGQDPSFDFRGPGFPTDGPYQVVAARSDGRVTLHPMKYYTTMSCGGYIKEVVSVTYSSRALVDAAAASRQVDVTFNDSLESLPNYQRHRGVYETFVLPDFNLEALHFNVDPTYQGQVNPLANADVRLALALALDKISVIKSVLPLTTNAAKTFELWTPWVKTPTVKTSYVDKNIVGQWDPIAGRFVTDTGHGRALTDARKLLARAGWEKGFSLELYTTNSPRRYAEEAAVAKSWAKIGVEAKPRFISPDALFADWDHGGIDQHGAFQVDLSLFFTYPDPDGLKMYFQSKYIDRLAPVHSINNGNISGVHDRLIDRDFDAAANTFKSKTRYRNYSAIQREMNQRAYWVPLYCTPIVYTSDGRVVHFMPNPYVEGGPTWNMYQWQVR